MHSGNMQLPCVANNRELIW